MRRVTLCTVVRSRDTSGTRFGAALLSRLVRHWEVRTENPIRWPVSALRHDPGRCGSERGCDGDDGDCGQGGGWPPGNHVGDTRRIPRVPPRAQARGGEEAPKRRTFLRAAPLAPELDRPPYDGAAGAAACDPSTRTSYAYGRDDPARPRATGGSQGARPSEGCDLRRLRSSLLRPGALGVVVRVPAHDDRGERAVPGSLPDGLERAAAVWPRLDCTPASPRGSSLLRRVRTRLEPVELQALVLVAKVRVGDRATRPRVPSPTAGRIRRKLR